MFVWECLRFVYVCCMNIVINNMCFVYAYVCRACYVRVLDVVLCVVVVGLSCCLLCLFLLNIWKCVMCPCVLLSARACVYLICLHTYYCYTYVYYCLVFCVVLHVFVCVCFLVIVCVWCVLFIDLFLFCSAVFYVVQCC